VSGLSFAYQLSRPAGQRIERSSVLLAGRPLDPAANYRIVSNDFVWNGGDAFSAATDGTEPVDVGADIDVLVAYLRAHPVLQPGRQDRITRLP